MRHALPFVSGLLTERAEVPLIHFDTAFYKILNSIGVVCDRTCHKLLFYVTSKFEPYSCTRYHDIYKKDGDRNKHDIFLCAGLGSEGRFPLS